MSKGWRSPTGVAVIGRAGVDIWSPRARGAARSSSTGEPGGTVTRGLSRSARGTASTPSMGRMASTSPPRTSARPFSEACSSLRTTGTTAVTKTTSSCPGDEVSGESVSACRAAFANSLKLPRAPARRCLPAAPPPRRRPGARPGATAASPVRPRARGRQAPAVPAWPQRRTPHRHGHRLLRRSARTSRVRR